jgi:hypothetical protein
VKVGDAKWRASQQTFQNGEKTGVIKRGGIVKVVGVVIGVLAAFGMIVPGRAMDKPSLK